MTRSEGRGRLAEGLAGILRVGTVVAVLTIAIGFIVASMTGLPSQGGRPLVDVILDAGPDAPIAVGLLTLTLLPVVAIAYVAWRLARVGEMARALTALAVLALLVAGLAIAVLVGSAS